jgi:hypothetical protein
MIIILAIILILINTSQVYAQSATESGSPDLYQVTENVRKRIQDVVKDKSLLSLSQETAYIGTLQTITNNTLSMLTDEGTQLASLSSKTKLIKLPSYQTILPTDLSIDGYLAAVGTPQADRVLDTIQIITQDAPPLAATDKHFYGLITQYSTDSNLLTLQNLQTNQSQTFLVGRKTALNQWQTDGTKKLIKRTQTLPLNNPAIVIYSPAASPDGGDLALDVLLNTLPNP